MKSNTEEKFIVELLFNEKISCKNIFNELDLDKLIFVASSHLIMPLLYSKLSKRRLINNFPKDFSNYLRDIYKINFNRNKKILDEIIFISKLFRGQSIDHVFIKGSSNIMSSIYECHGERMLSDIDILVDSSQSNQALMILKKNKYRDYSDKVFFNNRHLTRQVHKIKKIAVEIHTKITNKNHLSSPSILKNKFSVNNVYVPSKEDQCKILVYNDQINDFGYLFKSYKFKNYYDFTSINNKVEIYHNLNEDKFMKTFFKIGAKLNIDYFKDFKIKQNRIDELIIDNKFSNKNFSYLYYKLAKFIKFFPIRINQAKMFAINQSFRSFYMKKLMSKFKLQ